MQTKTLIGILVLVGVPNLLNARLQQAWTFEEMFQKADLVVIARVVSSKDVGKSTTLPEFPSPKKVVGVMTEFETRLLFKGPKDLTKFRLYHYRYESEEEEFAAANNPELVKIKKGEYPAFLLFLVKEPDGTYVPFGGQIDPAAVSVLDLRAGVI